MTQNVPFRAGVDNITDICEQEWRSAKKDSMDFIPLEKEELPPKRPEGFMVLFVPHSLEDVFDDEGRQVRSSDIEVRRCDSEREIMEMLSVGAPKNFALCPMIQRPPGIVTPHGKHHLPPPVHVCTAGKRGKPVETNANPVAPDLKVYAHTPPTVEFRELGQSPWELEQEHQAACKAQRNERASKFMGYSVYGDAVVIRPSGNQEPAQIEREHAQRCDETEAVKAAERVQRNKTVPLMFSYHCEDMSTGLIGREMLFAELDEAAWKDMKDWYPILNDRKGGNTYSLIRAFRASYRDDKLFVRKIVPKHLPMPQGVHATYFADICTWIRRADEIVDEYEDAAEVQHILDGPCIPTTPAKQLKNLPPPTLTPGRNQPGHRHRFDYIMGSGSKSGSGLVTEAKHFNPKKGNEKNSNLTGNWKKAIRGYQMDKVVSEASMAQHVDINPTMVDVKPNAWTQLHVITEEKKKKDASEEASSGAANSFLAGFAACPGGKSHGLSLSKSHF